MGEDQKHGLSEAEGEQLLEFLRNMAHAPPCHDGVNRMDYFYKLEDAKLKASQLWTKQAVQRWLSGR
jgi:hypothetical protein